jgi:hypothetical protein
VYGGRARGERKEVRARDYRVVCVCEFKTGPHSTAALMRARPRHPGGARLHDYWQQASKRGTTKEVRVLRVKTGRSSDTRNSGAFTALRCEARTQPRRGGRLSFSFTL